MPVRLVYSFIVAIWLITILLYLNVWQQFRQVENLGSLYNWFPSEENVLTLRTDSHLVKNLVSYT